MTNQSQPLTLKLSNGQEVSIAGAKSVLRHTENGQHRSCAIVRGPNGAAIYNADGDVEINGAPSSAHWLQPGDQLQFNDSLSASVEQLGVVSQELNSLLNQTQPATPNNEVQPSVPAPVQVEPASSAADQDTFTPATSAASFIPEPHPSPAPVLPTAPDVTELADTTPDLPTAGPTMGADLAIPAATLAALGVAAVSAEPSEESVAAAPQEPAGFSPVAAEPVSAVSPGDSETAPPTTGFAAELLARIQADDNNEQQNENVNETVGTSTSETTHSPLAADGHSFTSPVVEQNSISSLIPELPPTSTRAQEDQPASLEPSASSLAEATTTESAERQSQSSSVSALLERMKDEGQWGGLSEEAAAAATTPQTNETPVLNEADDDVQSYMSQLLSRMRDPDEEQQSVAAKVTSPEPAQEKQEPETPEPVGLLKPEEYVPKTKARRLDSLQDMRALANTQTRTAINRSQAKRLEATLGNYNLAIAVISFAVAAAVFMLNIFGSLSLSVAMIALICGGFYCCKAYFSELLEDKKKKVRVTTQKMSEPAQEAAQEAV